MHNSHNNSIRTSEVVIKALQINMNVRFPCTLTLERNGAQLTRPITNEKSKFVIN